MFINDVIKINYIRQGYLPNYPYHMISDKEMFSAFLHKDNKGYSGYFIDRYPLVSDKLSHEYNVLVDSIYALINSDKPLPDWVYAYMLGIVVSSTSQEADILYLATLFGIEASNITFDSEMSERCYVTSTSWVKKLNKTTDDRPATMFGEPHVVKSLRLINVNVL